MADAREITIPVQLDAGTFRRFACFDTLIRKKRGIRPVVFAVILIAFAIAALLSGKPQSGLIAGGIENELCAGLRRQRRKASADAAEGMARSGKPEI